MPTFDRERWRTLSPRLDRALEMEPGERAAWLADLRATEPGLAADLEALLEEHARVLQKGFLEGAPPPVPSQPSLEGLEIGAYRLRAPLGQGGMGSVWLAERVDGRYEGVVAIKLLNASLMGRRGEARFQREGSLLARLRHPHIAHLVDAGVSPLGQPYLVLEYVDGEPIDRHCDGRRLPIDARVRLFLDVLAAVAYAHAHLIVHRDVKPANVFVDRNGRVKLLDFGIAKLVDAETGTTGPGPLTRHGEAALTPECAAPEQLTGGEITTVTDVYALGVLLYVLLAGRHPLGAGPRSAADLVKAVVEGEPPRLSDAIGAGPGPGSAGDSAGPAAPAGAPGTAPDIAARRSTHPARLRRLLQGDLENIVAKAIKKNPAERYASVEAFADDLRRYLGNEPVSARADSFAYRLAKFTRRHRRSVVAVVAVMGALVAGTAGVAWQAREARIQRDAARTQLARATAAGEFMGFLLSAAAPGGTRFTTAELLEQGETLIEKQFAHDDPMRAEMLATIGEHYMSAERWEKATPVLERAARIVEDSADTALRARALCPLALLKVLNGDRAGGEAMMGRALADLAGRPEQVLQRAECLIRRGEFGYVTGEAAPMIRDATEALALLDRAPVPTTEKRIDAEATLAYGYYLARRNRDADRAYARVMSALETLGRDRTATAASVLNNWSLVHFQGDISRAEPLCRRAVELYRSIDAAGGVVPSIAFNYAGLLLELGRLEEARPVFEETIRTAAARQEDRIFYDATMQLAEVDIVAGDLRRARAQLDRTRAFESSPRFNAFRRAQRSYYEGELALAGRDPAAARSAFADSVAAFDRFDAKIALNVKALIGLARAEMALGDGDAALAAAGRALTMATSFVEEGSPSYLVGLAQAALGEIHLANGRTEDARRAFRTAVEHLGPTLGAGHAATRAALRGASPPPAAPAAPGAGPPWPEFQKSLPGVSSGPSRFRLRD